jgi:hypothetical protein
MAVMNGPIWQPPISHLTVKLQNVFVREFVGVGFIATSQKLIERSRVYLGGFF